MGLQIALYSQAEVWDFFVFADSSRTSLLSGEMFISVITENSNGIRRFLFISSIFFAFGIFQRVNSKVLAVLFIVLNSYHYLFYDAPVPWLYFWFPLVVFACFDFYLPSVFALFKNARKELSYSPPAWPRELLVIWFVFIYAAAGISKIFPIEKLWISGGAVQDVMYNRYLDSILHYVFQRPLFDYSEPNSFFVFGSVIAVASELACLLMLLTERWNHRIYFLIMLLYFVLLLIGVSGFAIFAFILGIALLKRGVFDRLQTRLIKTGVQT